MAVSGGPESPSEQHYSLKWNDYSVKLVTAFQSLRDEEDFVDVTVACDGHQYSAHKMVLSACSPYFRTMLRANPCQHPIVILKDVGHCELERLLEFMYNGEVNIAQDQLAAFLRTADNLKIRGLAGSSDEMEQICNRDYLLASTEKCLSEQHINNTCSSKSSVNSCNNNNNGNSLSKDDESASAAAAGMVASVGGSECYSPVPKKRKFILLAGCDQDVDEDLASAVDASDAVAETMVSPPAAALGVEVKCLARELKAEPCDVVSDSSVATVAGLAAADVYNTADAAVDSTHMYTLGVGANNSNSCNVSSGQHDLNAPHTEQGGAFWGDHVAGSDHGIAAPEHDIGAPFDAMGAHFDTVSGDPTPGRLKPIHDLTLDNQSQQNTGMSDREIFGLFQRDENSLQIETVSSMVGENFGGNNFKGAREVMQHVSESRREGREQENNGTDSLQQKQYSENQHEYRRRLHHAPYCMCQACRGCSFCGKLFSTVGSRKRHERDKHVETQAISCDLCGKWCKNKGALIKHKSLLHRPKDYSGDALVSTFLQGKHSNMNISVTHRRPSVEVLPFGMLAASENGIDGISNMESVRDVENIEASRN